MKREAYLFAKKVLEENSTKKGFVAAKNGKENYNRIWSRDGVVQTLAALALKDKALLKTAKKTLETLHQYQDETGRIPSNIPLEKGEVSYGMLVGRVDATIWYGIGVIQFGLQTNKSFLKKFYPSLERVRRYLNSLELNGRGLLYIPPGGDWADEYVTHGYSLFDQVLYYEFLCGLKKVNTLLGKKQTVTKKEIDELTEFIRVNYFPSTNRKDKSARYHQLLYDKLLKMAPLKYPLASFSPDGFITRLDGFALSLLLNANFLPTSLEKKVQNALEERLRDQRVKVLPAFWPPIKRKDPLWRRLKFNAMFRFKNKPHHFHNGGLWPMIQGVYLVSLKRTNEKKYDELIEDLAREFARDHYQFREYIESKQYTWQGTKHLGFSAAGYILAYTAPKSGRLFEW